jgi:hypothetical protein
VRGSNVHSLFAHAKEVGGAETRLPSYTLVLARGVDTALSGGHASNPSVTGCDAASVNK